MNPIFLFPKVDLDESLFRKYGFKRTMEFKWKVEDLVDSFLSTDLEVLKLVQEFTNEIQKKN